METSNQKISFIIYAFSQREGEIQPEDDHLLRGRAGQVGEIWSEQRGRQQTVHHESRFREGGILSSVIVMGARWDWVSQE